MKEVTACRVPFIDIFTPSNAPQQFQNRHYAGKSAVLTALSPESFCTIFPAKVTA
jgi:hypothetical protein